MERVHFYQEQMLPELKELEERGIFSQLETQAILKQRTAFESALVRRVALKSDFLKYVQYEVTLEALRKKRVARLNATETKTSLSDYCIIRRQFYILERAVRKFKSDVSLWVQYIEVAKSNNARSLVGKLCSRALSLHPTSPNLYIIAASHELDSTLSPTGARTLLQRGLRINPESVALWTEYVRMELGYCEGLRRRWKALGIDPTSPGEDGEPIQVIVSGGIARAVISSATQSLPTLELLGSLQTLLQSYPTELRATLLDFLHSEFAVRDTGSGPAGEDFRCGAIVLRATVEIPSRPLQNDSQLPKVPPLRPLLAAAFPEQPTPFTSESQTGEFVKRIQKANETLSFTSKTDLRVAELYARWVASWVPAITENNLRLYLVLGLTTLAKQLCKQHYEPALLPVLATVLRISLHLNKTICADEIQSRKLSQKFSRKCLDDVGLWLARLDAESGAMRPIDSELSIYSPPITIPEPIHKLWGEAREKARAHTNEDDSLVELWLWGLNHMKGSNSAPREHTWEAILRQSLSHKSPTLHSQLLFRRLYDIEDSSSERSQLARKLITQYRPSVLFFDLAMDREVLLLLPGVEREANREQGPPRKKQKANQGAQTQVVYPRLQEYQCLEVLYNSWRVIADQQVPATLKWAKSLHQLGQKAEAEEAIRIAGGSKGRLKLEWERVRGGVHENKPSSGVEQSSGDDTEKDISLEKVEYN